MKITIKFFAVIREIVGKKEETLELKDAPTILSVLQVLSEKYGEQFRSYVFDAKTDAPRTNLQFMIDGKNSTTMDGLKTRLGDGSVLAIIPPVGGG